MANKRGRPAQKDALPILFLGLRANVHEAQILNRASELDRRNRNAFCLLASLAAAREVLAAHGVREEDVLAEIPAPRKSA